nr:MAG TPA: hypothetical protein [Caudoviricetes sp.]
MWQVRGLLLSLAGYRITRKLIRSFINPANTRVINLPRCTALRCAFLAIAVLSTTESFLLPLLTHRVSRVRLHLGHMIWCRLTYNTARDGFQRLVEINSPYRLGNSVTNVRINSIRHDALSMSLFPNSVTSKEVSGSAEDKGRNGGLDFTRQFDASSVSDEDENSHHSANHSNTHGRGLGNITCVAFIAHNIFPSLRLVREITVHSLRILIELSLTRITLSLIGITKKLTQTDSQRTIFHAVRDTHTELIKQNLHHAHTCPSVLVDLSHSFSKSASTKLRSPSVENNFFQFLLGCHIKPIFLRATAPVVIFHCAASHLALTPSSRALCREPVSMLSKRNNAPLLTPNISDTLSHSIHVTLRHARVTFQSDRLCVTLGVTIRPSRSRMIHNTAHNAIRDNLMSTRTNSRRVTEERHHLLPRLPPLRLTPPMQSNIRDNTRVPKC